MRPYRRADRADVRRICVETGYLGDPVWWLYPDAESFADLFATWYVDHEPEHAWVIDDGTGRVRGYLLGAVDSAAVPSHVGTAVHHTVRRGLLARPGTRAFWWRAALDVVCAGGRVEPDVDLRRFPAHLHVDLLPEVRGLGLGTELVRTWLGFLRRHGVPGVHVTTFAENARARAFFGSLGFEPHGTARPAPGFRTHLGDRMASMAMATDLATAGAPGTT